MRKLLSANLLRMIKNKIFWLGTIFMLVFGIAMPVMHYFSMQKYNYTMYIDMGFFTCTVLLMIIMAVFCSLFLGTEYSDGVIRNKIVVGQKRTVIYFSNLITCVIAGIIMCAVWFVSYLSVGLPLLKGFQTEINTVFLYLLCVLILIIAFTSLYTLIAMTNQKKSIIAVVCVLCAFLLLFAEVYITASLNEPEMYSSYSYIDDSGNIVTEEAEANPHYLRGTMRGIYEFLDDFLPGGQALKIANMSAENPWLLMLYSSIIIVGTTGAGLWVFRKKDLK